MTATSSFLFAQKKSRQFLPEFVFGSFSFAKMHSVSVALVFKRGQGRKAGMKDGTGTGDHVCITLEVLQELGHQPVARAAVALGISTTALKGACRKLGISRWPYMAGRGGQRIDGRADKDAGTRAVQDAGTQTDVSFGGVYGCELPALVDTDAEFDAPEDVLDVWRD